MLVLQNRDLKYSNWRKLQLLTRILNKDMDDNSFRTPPLICDFVTALSNFRIYSRFVWKFEGGDANIQILIVLYMCVTLTSIR